MRSSVVPQGIGNKENYGKGIGSPSRGSKGEWKKSEKVAQAEIPHALPVQGVQVSSDNFVCVGKDEYDSTCDSSVCRLQEGTLKSSVSQPFEDDGVLVVDDCVAFGRDVDESLRRELSDMTACLNDAEGELRWANAGTRPASDVHAARVFSNGTMKRTELTVSLSNERLYGELLEAEDERSAAQRKEVRCRQEITAWQSFCNDAQQGWQQSRGELKSAEASARRANGEVTELESVRHASLQELDEYQRERFLWQSELDVVEDELRDLRRLAASASVSLARCPAKAREEASHLYAERNALLRSQEDLRVCSQAQVEAHREAQAWRKACEQDRRHSEEQAEELAEGLAATREAELRVSELEKALAAERSERSAERQWHVAAIEQWRAKASRYRDRARHCRTQLSGGRSASSGAQHNLAAPRLHYDSSGGFGEAGASLGARTPQG